MNDIVNKVLLAGDKCMPEMLLRQPGFTYRIQKFKETRDSQYVYQNELDKTCFQHDRAYGDIKDLTKKNDFL